MSHSESVLLSAPSVNFSTLWTNLNIKVNCLGVQHKSICKGCLALGDASIVQMSRVVGMT